MMGLSAPTTPRDLFKLFSTYDPQNGIGSMLGSLDYKGVSRRQVLYSIFGKLPETADKCRTPEGYSPLLHYTDLVHSESFQRDLIERLAESFCDKNRLIFVHIPKCAGTDLIANISPHFPSINQSISDPQWTNKALLFDKLREIVIRLEGSNNIFINGHIRLNDLLKSQLVRFNDKVFTVVRDPISIVLSQVNYIMTRFIDDPKRELPDTREWLKYMDLQMIPESATQEYFRSLANRVLYSADLMKGNLICRFLGGGDRVSAINNIIIADAQITDTSRYSEWLRTAWDISSNTKFNVSKQVITRENITRQEMEHVMSLVNEDTPLYDQIVKKLDSSSAPFIQAAKSF